MTRLAIIDLDVPGSERRGRVFLQRSLLGTTSVESLERELATRFVEDEDEPRMRLLEPLLRDNDVVQVTIHPGETSPPEYHAYLRDPLTPDAPIFACVLAPIPVIAQLLGEAPHRLFETATFQAIEGDGTAASMVAALESWGGRVWPGLKLPRFDVVPWPVESIPITPGVVAMAGAPKKAPRGAQLALLDADYPTAEELSA